MHDITHPAPLADALESIGLADLLDGYIARERIGVRYREIERAAQRFGYAFKHEDGNVYGRLQLAPIAPAAPAPVVHLITRSDHAAVYGSRKRVA